MDPSIGTPSQRSLDSNIKVTDGSGAMSYNLYTAKGEPQKQMLAILTAAYGAGRMVCVGLNNEEIINVEAGFSLAYRYKSAWNAP